MHNQEYTRQEADAAGGTHFIKAQNLKDPSKIPDPAKSAAIPFMDAELTDMPYEFSGTKHSIPRRAFAIEEGEVKRIPKIMLANPALMSRLKVRPDLVEEHATPLERPMMQVNAGGKIEPQVPKLTAKQIDDLTNAVRVGDPSAAQLLKKFNLSLEEAAGKVDNSTGRVFESLEHMLEFKRKKILGL